MTKKKPNQDMTSASLLLRLNRDGPAREVAWTEFYDLYAPIISGFARRIGADPREIDDLVQDVLRAFFAVSPEFVYDPAKGRFRGYLKTCVWHKVGESRRKRFREMNAIEKAGHDKQGQEVEEVWNDVWETEKLHRALSATCDRYATNAERQRTFRAFEMCVILGRDTRSVADELDMKVDSVRAAKSRVGKALRESYEQLDKTIG